MPKIKKSNRYILEGTTFLGFLTAIVYFFPYTYQASYLSHFGVPAIYQSFDLKSSIDASLSLIHYVFAIIALIGATFCMIVFVDKMIVHKLEEHAKKSEKFKRKLDFIGYITFIIIIPFFIIYLLKNSSVNVLIMALFLISAGVGCIYIYIFLRRKSFFLSASFTGILIFFFFVIGFLYFGQEEASKRDVFYVINDNDKDYIVLGMREDYYTVVRFNKLDNEIIQEYKLIPLTAEGIYLERLYLDKPPAIIKKRTD